MIAVAPNYFPELMSPTRRARHFEESRNREMIEAAERGVRMLAANSAGSASRVYSGGSAAGAITHPRRASACRWSGLDAIALCRENAVAQAIARVFGVQSLIGSGMSAQSAAVDDGVRESHTAWFDRWSRLVGRNGETLWRMQRLAARDAFLFGDTFFLRLNGGKLQHIPSRLVTRSSGGIVAGNDVIDGVEVDRDGNIVAYHVTMPHAARRSVETIRYPAEHVIHWMYRQESSTDVRGYPAFESTHDAIHLVPETIDAVAVAHKLSACIALVRTLHSQQAATGEADSQGRSIERFESGMIADVSVGESITQLQPSHPHPQLRDLMKQMITIAAMEFGVPIPQLTGDFSETNYSSARMADNLLQMAIAPFRDDLVFGPLAKVWGHAIEWGVASGQIEPAADQAEHQWQPPHRYYQDPQVEVAADASAVAAGLDTTPAAISRRGRDAREMVREQQEYERFVIEERAKTEQLARDLGVATREEAVT